MGKIGWDGPRNKSWASRILLAQNANLQTPRHAQRHLDEPNRKRNDVKRDEAVGPREEMTGDWQHGPKSGNDEEQDRKKKKGKKKGIKLDSRAHSASPTTTGPARAKHESPGHQHHSA